jgi:hypothetical protein
MATYYRNPQIINGSWDFAATTDPKVAAANQLNYQQIQWNLSRSNGEFGPYGVFAPPEPTAASVQPIAVDMSLAKNGTGLGLSEQTMASMLSTYQAGKNTGAGTVRPYQMTPAEQKTLGISSDASFLNQFDPTQPNWNADKWTATKPGPSGGFFGSNFLPALSIALPAIGAGMFGPALGAAGSGAEALAAPAISNGISDVATQAAIDSIMGNTTNMIGTNLANAGFNVGAGLGVAGAATGLLGGSSPAEAAAFAPGADISSGYGVTNGTLAGNSTGVMAPTGSGGLFGGTDSLIPGVSNSSLIGGGLNVLGGILGGNAAKDAAQTAADAQLQAAKIAADAAKFKPVGVTTNFGKSQFGYDANGNLTSAGYQLSPQLQAQQNQIMAGTNPLLTQALGAQAATAPMGNAAQRMMTLGNGYLASTPQEQAAKWLADQRALLTQGDQSNYAQLQAQLQAQGRGGLMTGGGNGFAAANPEMNAYYNAMQQRDLGLAANATQQGQQYATYGANLVGSGGQMLDSMYSTQSNAYNPYKTALGQASTIEGLGQNALDQGINLGAKGTAATAQSGMLLGQGMSNAAQTMQQANAYSPWATGLSNLGNLFQQSGAQAQPQGYQFNPYTGKSLLG